MTMRDFPGPEITATWLGGVMMQFPASLHDVSMREVALREGIFELKNTREHRGRGIVQFEPHHLPAFIICTFVVGCCSWLRLCWRSEESPVRRNSRGNVKVGCCT